MGGFVRTLTGSKAAKASNRAAAGQAEGIEAGAQIQADAQMAALDYLKEREALPQQFRESALGQIGGLYGIGDVSGDQALASLRSSPMYGAITSQRAAGEDAILRNQAMTGGLRSGNTQDALARYSGDLENQALMQSLSGLQGLASLPSNASQIASGISGVGQTLGQGVMGSAQTLAQGQVAGAQAQQAGLGGLLTAGLGAAGLAFSDPRLKTNVQAQGERSGHKWYSWTWNKAAEALGLKGDSEGVMAHEVLATHPEHVSTRDGYMVVNYAAIGA
jgi:hypothetical protein